MDILLAMSAGIFIGITADKWFSFLVRIFYYVYKRFKGMSSQHNVAKIVQDVQEVKTEVKRGRGRPKKTS